MCHPRPYAVKLLGARALGSDDFVVSGSPGNTNSFGLTVQNLLGKQGRGRVEIQKPE